MTFGDVRLAQRPPKRTDDNEESVPALKLKVQRPLEDWQRLPHREVRRLLLQAQSRDNGETVMCAGCGREMEADFMELDHVLPRSDGGANDISNRILLCIPCNRRKSNAYTLSGLLRENRKADWIHDEDIAKLALALARGKADAVKGGAVV